MDVYTTVERFIAESIIGQDQSFRPDADTDLQESGVLDSLSTLKLVSFLEETFGISFESADLNAGGFASIGNIVRLVDAKRAAAAAASTA